MKENRTKAEKFVNDIYLYNKMGYHLTLPYLHVQFKFIYSSFTIQTNYLFHVEAIPVFMESLSKCMFSL